MGPISHTKLFAVAGAGALLVFLAGCGTTSSVQGPEDGASTEAAARNVQSNDPLARPTQVGWTSARATRCGFMFDPQQLRANYLAYESRLSSGQARMQKIEKAYDYTRESMLITINKNPSYCSKDRLGAIRVDLNRYLSGDYRPMAR